MGKIWHVLAVAFLFVGVLTPPAAAQIKKGVKTGLNISKFGGDFYGYTTELKVGFCIGGFLQFPLSDALKIQPELLWTQKGAEIDLILLETSSPEITTQPLRVNLDYLEIPVLVKYTLGSENRMRPIFYIGPAMGIKLNSYASMNGEDYKLADDGFKGTDFGLIFGLGGSLKRGSDHEMTLEVRYNLGLSSIDNTEENAGIKNQNFSFMIGYSF